MAAADRWLTTLTERRDRALAHVQAMLAAEDASPNDPVAGTAAALAQLRDAQGQLDALTQATA